MIIRSIFIFLLLIAFQYTYAQKEETLTPEKHFDNAEKLLREGRCKDALNHINKLLAVKSSDAAYSLRARIHECLGDYNAAITDFSVLIHSHPENAEYLFSRGVLRYQTGKYTLALIDLHNALKYPVNETNTVFYKIEKGDSGISGLSTLNTMHDEIHNYLGLTYHETRKYDSAVWHFSKALSYQETPRYLNNRGLSYEKSGYANMAVSDYENALRIEEYNQVAIYNLIRLYGDLKQYDRQREILSFLGRDTKLPEIHVFKGVAAYNTGDYKTAIREYDSALLLNDGNEEYYLYRGQAYEKTKKYDLAIDDYHRAIAIDIDYPQAYFGLGNVYYQKNDLDSALFHYNLALLYNPEFGKAYLNRSYTYLRKKDLENACKDLLAAQRFEVAEATEVFRKKCGEE